MHRFIRLSSPQTVCFQNKVLWHSALCNYTMMDSTTLIMEPLWATGSPGWICSRSLTGAAQTYYKSNSVNPNKQAQLPWWSKACWLDLRCQDYSTTVEPVPASFVLCNWIKSTASSRSGTSSPDEPRLKKLRLLSTNFGSDKAVMEGRGPAEQPPRAGSTQRSKWAPSIKPHDTKSTARNVPCISFCQRDLFYIKAPKLAALNKGAHIHPPQKQCKYAFISGKNCWINALCAVHAVKLL